MEPHVERRIRAQRSEALRRLADKAEREGVTIYVTRDGEHLATSRRNPTQLHRVDRYGCDCAGFSYWQRCGHHSLLLSQMGLILDENAVDCPACQGKGWGEPWRVPGTDAYAVRCRACEGKGWTPVAVIVAEGQRRPATVVAAA